MINLFKLPATGVQASEGPTIMKIRILIVYLGSLFALFVPPNAELLALMFIGFYVRSFGGEGGLHRYFAHRSYKTSRAFQFILACLGASAGHRGPLWWAWSHRRHHRFSDTPRDLHSPMHKGRFYVYLGWLVDEKNCNTDLDEVKDLSRFPELVWINKYHYLFPYIYLFIIYAIGEWSSLLGGGQGWAAVVWGFFVSTLISLQGPTLVNVFSHSEKTGFFTSRPYNTNDKSVNNWLLSVISMGVSWHNNHHRYMNSARIGLQWWEIDLTYLTLRFLALFGIVWDLNEVPAQVFQQDRVNWEK